MEQLRRYLKYKAKKEPNRDYLPYENEDASTQPLLRRTTAKALAARKGWDTSWRKNPDHWANKTYGGIVARGYDTKHTYYDNYGGRPMVGPFMEEAYTGRYVFRHAENAIAFLNFVLLIETILGRPPDESYTIDKLSNSSGYVPNNIKWSSKREQTHNRFTFRTRFASRSWTRFRDFSASPNHKTDIPSKAAKHFQPLQAKTTNQKLFRITRKLFRNPASRRQERNRKWIKRTLLQCIPEEIEAKYITTEHFKKHNTASKYATTSTASNITQGPM